MKIGEVGGKFREADEIDYRSDQTFLDYDVVIIDLATALLYSEKHQGDIYLKRKKSLKEFLQHKKTPIILFTPKPQHIKFVMGAMTREATLGELLPIPLFIVGNEKGKRLVVVPNTPFTEFFRKYESYFHYESVFEVYNGTVLLEVPHTKKVLAFYNAETVVLPPFLKSISEIEEIFLEDLLAIVTNLNNKSAIEIPAWSSKYQLPLEAEAADTIGRLRQKIETLQMEMEQQKEKLELIEQYKVLFTGTGITLEDGVQKIFEELGFKILPVAAGRHDLIMKYGVQDVVCEIKGVTGSGTEKHAAQLQKWVGIYHVDEGRLPKGILIVNPFNDKELNERTGDPFPHQMLPYAKRMDHCLITSLQLLALYYAVMKDPSRKENLITALLETVGEYPEFKDWTNFITIRKETSQEE